MYIYMYVYICVYIYICIYISLGHYKQNTTAMVYFVVFGCIIDENHFFFNSKVAKGRRKLTKDLAIILRIG